MTGRKIISIALLFLLFILHTADCRAAVIEIQPLDFGRWLVAGNNGVQNITLQTDSSYSNSAGIIMLSPPQAGIFLISGLPISQIISSVTITMTQAMSSGAGEVFTMDNFTYDAPPSTDGSGEATITIGARARTSGNGNPYANDVFNGDLEITFNF